MRYGSKHCNLSNGAFCGNRSSVEEKKKKVKGMSPKGREIFWSTNACPKLDTGYHYRPCSWDTSGRVPFKNPLFFPPPGFPP
ncbi:unnamed protein product [Gulo gulo]|uniref:Uncharacterized protein n=1 Tax=Gulo gulo TaxID=48420 RepID=A0A9X9Q1Q5_GULGU|nr:unnamed protein product [Gulo gulo]